MKKLLVLLALCMVLSVVLVACQNPDQPTEDTTAGSTEAPTTEAPTTEAPTTEEPTTEAPTTDAPTTDAPTTEPPTTEPPTTEPPEPPVDPVKSHLSFDECDPWIGETQGTGFFTPGQSNTWDKIANVEDYNVSAIRVWGWVAWYTETPGVYGYQIGDADPVFDDAFTVEAEQGVVDAALTMGGKSGTRMKIMIPVEYVGGEGIVIKALAKDVHGTVETLVEFTLNKAENPNAPAAFIPAADMASSIPGSPGVNGCTLSADGNYVTIDTINQGDPYYQLPMMNGKGTVGAFVAIKYRSTSTYTKSEMFVGSGAGPSGQGDNIQFDLVCDGNWNLAVVDLAQATAVVDGVINYLRWDPFAGAGTDTIDMAYIAVFGNYEAAFAYDAQFAGIYRDVPAHSDLAVDLGVRTSGGPYSGSKIFGQKLPLGETFLKQITIKEMATYADGNTNTWALKIWAWNTDYATTVAGTPLFVTTGENHNDNTDFVVDVPAKLLISGDVYYEIEYLTGSAQFTGWAADAILVEGVETYVGGNLQEGTYASSVVVGVELPPVETIYYDGENGTTTVPVQGVKYFVRNAGGMTLVIENAFNFVITADNLMGATAVLQPDMFGKIEIEVPADWMQFELTIDNVCGEPAEYSMSFVAPVEPGAGDGTPDAPYVMSGIEGTISAEIITGWDSVFYTFTAEADGVLSFVGPDNMSIFIEDAYGSEWLFDGNGTYAVTAGTTYKFFVADANFAAGTIEGTWSFATGAATPENQTASVVIADYATANNWENSTLYAEVQVNADVTVSVTGTPASDYGQNSGKYYTSDTTWRIYQNETPAITVTAAEGKTIVSVKVTYVSNKTGVLLNGDAQIESDAVIEVNANSITLGVGNTDASVTNGQVRITAIEVIYN